MYPMGSIKGVAKLLDDNEPSPVAFKMLRVANLNRSPLPVVRYKVGPPTKFSKDRVVLSSGKPNVLNLIDLGVSLNDESYLLYREGITVGMSTARLITNFLDSAEHRERTGLK